MNLPPQYEVIFRGQAKMLGETAYYFMVALGLSILFMYLILAAQFESWLHPITILAALPVTIPFGLLSLVLFRQPMDLYAMFGLFMLIGIVKKNGILQVDKTNELRRDGHGPRRGDPGSQPHPAAADPDDDGDADRGDDPDRLGPRARRGRRASMAKVIIGGQMLSLLLALLVTPVTYSLLDSFVGLFRRKKKAPSAAPSWWPPRPNSGTACGAIGKLPRTLAARAAVCLRGWQSSRDTPRMPILMNRARSLAKVPRRRLPGIAFAHLAVVRAEEADQTALPVRRRARHPQLSRIWRARAAGVRHRRRPQVRQTHRHRRRRREGRAAQREGHLRQRRDRAGCTSARSSS